ncbi:protein FAR-RED IMPAIRED RESPONSE 1-like isoform X2 [Rhododendron vialii]|uniref:protein FAR-RED IMPAIRED RESPONSE 1-like isoform X2 n=1 Tax=Rhododendron vialii TaxID=182163 RepID=UPI00265EEE6E|nr:protein FAR-RED IMPAIRED RESPONSE 1-like isoform X2 [Rhododendron vialii]
MRKVVYDSLTIKQFEDTWDIFIKKYELQSNTWLQGLYLERKRWMPAYLKDMFWAGMSSTQRSESMNAYFNCYIHKKTTLKQFVEKYENALANKVESKNELDAKSLHTYIPLLTEDELEKQFQSAYTNSKFQEFQKQFFGKLDCLCSKTKECGIMSEYEVQEWITFGEEEEKKRKQVSFTVDFNSETNETHCNCRLFDFRGMVCTHQLMVWFQRGIQKVPDKYVLKRWCKNVKRVHTKVRICYDKLSTSIEAHRHDNMCNLFNEVADLAKASQEKYDMVMTRVRELKRELMDVSVNCESNVGFKTPNDSFSLGDEVIKTKQSTNILDPEGLRRKGRPPCKRMQGVVEKAVKKKIEKKKTTLPREKAKVEEIVVDHVFGTQESVVNLNSHQSYMGQSMWPNLMPHNMQPNMAQGGSIFQFSPSSCPTGTGFNQFMYMFPSSQTNMPSLFNSHDWRGHSNITSRQVWGGGQLSFLKTQEQCVGGPPQSFMEMLNASDNAEE